MKVLHISTFTGGGAGTAAVRLHKGLIREGVDSNFLALYGAMEQVPKIFLFSPDKFTIAKKIIGGLLSISKTQRNAIRVSGKEGLYEIFTFPNTDYDISKHPLIAQSDIINLHWIANFVDYPSFFAKVKKPIVWTLHDMNPFQGGFHYKDDEIRNHSVFNELNVRLKSKKRNAYKKSCIKKIIAPSVWLKNESSKSNLLGMFGHIQIPYGLDIDVFCSYETGFARQVFQLPKEKKILLFVAEDIDNTRKGFDLLLGVVGNLAPMENCLLIAVGKVPDNKIEGVVYLGSIRDERLMALVYSAADAFVLTSREDNLPNVVLESLSCGTPVIATPVGGILDVIKDGFNGYLAREVSVRSFYDAIKRFIDDGSTLNRQKIREDAVRKFNLELQAKRYAKLYSAVIQNS